MTTQHELSLAYTPGVAVPCLRIQANAADAYRYTNKGNLVAVITNGTAILGLGNIGTLAGKPVMEGKAVLFKKFAGIDVFDIEVEATGVDELVDTVRRIAPTFGGINLEDIKAPECFEVERRLKEALDIPVFHDDQHGTAIISAAALVGAAELAKKALADLRVVVAGAGAAGIACIDMWVELGVARGNVIFTDSKGVVWKGRREGMNSEKEKIAVVTPHRTLAQAMVGADVFLGVSGPNIVSQDMVRSMAARPIVFAMANPDPEITYPAAVAARDDVIMATGRSDFPNQVNNVLCFPFMFRGALDVKARAISHAMKVAAARALAELTREDVPESVCEAYGGERLTFGPRYIIPKPFDHRVLLWVAPAVAEAAVKDGTSPLTDFDVEAYRRSLSRYLGGARQVMAGIEDRAGRRNARVAFAEGDEPRALRAAAQVLEQGIGRPVIVGDEARIREVAAAANVDLDGMTICDPRVDPRGDALARRLYDIRKRKGLDLPEARRSASHPRRHALLLLDAGEVDVVVTGVRRNYPDGVRDALQIVGTQPGARAAALHVMVLKDRTLFLVGHVAQHRPGCRGARRDRDRGGRRRARLRRRAARRDALVLQLRQRPAPVAATLRAGHATRARVAPRHRDRRRDARRRCARPAGRGAHEPRLAHPGRRERADLPRPREREHRLQAPPVPRRRRGDRPAPARARAPRGRLVSGGERADDRQPDGDRRGRDAQAGGPVGRLGPARAGPERPSPALAPAGTSPLERHLLDLSGRVREARRSPPRLRGLPASGRPGAGALGVEADDR